MEKIRLALDDLSVQSFATTDGAAGARGTVRGRDAPTDQVECPTADVNWNTCWDTCGESCGCGGGSGNTCDGSCDCYSAWCSWGCWGWWTISWC
ncbi:MAG TPA: hypothetical protein VF541_09570 [Longimicrobium sp.]|jgi:hypothetical protein